MAEGEDQDDDCANTPLGLDLIPEFYVSARPKASSACQPWLSCRQSKFPLRIGHMSDKSSRNRAVFVCLFDLGSMDLNTVINTVIELAGNGISSYHTRDVSILMVK